MTDDEGNRDKSVTREEKKRMKVQQKNYVFSFVFCSNITITVTPRSIVLEALTQGCFIKPNITAVFLNPL